MFSGVFFNFLKEDPAYSFSYSFNYNHKRLTKLLKITYYVNQDFYEKAA